MTEYELINQFDQGQYRTFQFKTINGQYFEYTINEEEYNGVKPEYDELIDVIANFYESNIKPLLEVDGS